MDDYESLLKRVKEGLPKEIEKHERFTVPEADIFIEGKTTVFKNFGEIADVIRRDKNEVLAYMLRELGTGGVLEGARVVFKSKVSKDQIEKRIREYVGNYVLCAECNRPDTHLLKDGRISILECEACGARRPITVRKAGKGMEEDVLKEGNVYEVQIIDIGKKGDGLAKRDRYVIYVPGTTKGTTVKIKIEKIVDTIAYAQVVRE